jgi:hypothetical protein
MLPFLIPMLLGAAMGAGKTALSKGHHGIGDYLKNAGIGGALGGLGGAGLGAMGGGGAAAGMSGIGPVASGAKYAAMLGGGGEAGGLGSFATQHPLLSQMGKLGMKGMQGMGQQQPQQQPVMDYGPNPIPMPAESSPQQPQQPVQVSSMFPQQDPFRQRFGGYGGYNG